jgi:hypothetical protein
LFLKDLSGHGRHGVHRRFAHGKNFEKAARFRVVRETCTDGSSFAHRVEASLYQKADGKDLINPFSAAQGLLKVRLEQFLSANLRQSSRI